MELIEIDKPLILTNYKARFGNEKDWEACLNIRNYHFDPVSMADFKACLELRAQLAGRVIELALLLHPSDGSVCAFCFYIVSDGTMYFLEEAVRADLNEKTTVETCLKLVVALAEKLRATKVVFYMKLNRHHPAAYLKKLGFTQIYGEGTVNKRFYHPTHESVLLEKYLGLPSDDVVTTP